MRGGQPPGRGVAVIRAYRRKIVMALSSVSRHGRRVLIRPFLPQRPTPTVRPVARMRGAQAPGRGSAAMVELLRIVLERCTAFQLARRAHPEDDAQEQRVAWDGLPTTLKDQGQVGWDFSCCVKRL